MKKCPFCAEEVQDEAIFCRHCKTHLNQPQNYDKKYQEKSELPQIQSNTTTIIKQVNSSPNYCAWGGGCCLLLLLSPILLPLFGLGGMISFVALLYIGPLALGLLIGYFVYWHTKLPNKKSIAINIIIISAIITALWIGWIIFANYNS